LQAIIAAPDDDGPRLIFADWLEERGQQEHAAFLRQSLALAGLPEGHPDRPPLAAQVKALEKQRVRTWREAFGSPAPVPTFVRGMVEEVYYSGPHEFFATGEALVRAEPVRRVTIHAYKGSAFNDEQLHRLAGMPELLRLNALILWDHHHGSAEGWSALLASPFLVNLTTLSLANCGLADDVVAVLTGSPTLAGLRVLDLTMNALGPEGARALIRSPYLPNIQRLYLGENLFGEDPEEEAVMEELEARFGAGLQWEAPDDDL
jgi:uncharacterized protein (TIGR02996 family)